MPAQRGDDGNRRAGGGEEGQRTDQVDLTRSAGPKTKRMQKTKHKENKTRPRVVVWFSPCVFSGLFSNRAQEFKAFRFLFTCVLLPVFQEVFGTKS